MNRFVNSMPAWPVSAATAIAIATIIAFALGIPGVSRIDAAYALELQTAAVAQDGDYATKTAVQSVQASHLRTVATPSIDEVRSLIASLPAITQVTESDGDLIRQTRSAYDALSADERALLDTETNRELLGTTQSYGRVLELAEAGYAVLHPIDDSTTLADGIYTSSISSTWDRGKSASKQDRDWTAVKVRVESGKALVTMRINSPTYSVVRASGQVVNRLARSAADESLFTFPVSLGTRMVFSAYSQTMATEIAYYLTVQVATGAQPDAELSSEIDEGDPEDPNGQGQDDTPIIRTDDATGNVIVERGTFSHPEIKGYMFRIVAPSYVNSDGQVMSAYAQMPSASYTYLFVGTLEQANQMTLAQGIENGLFIPATRETNASGSIVSSFNFQLASLDQEITLCLYSAKNEHWVEHVITYNSADLTWHETDAEQEQLAEVVELLENLPARNTIVPDNPEHEAVVQAARDAYESLNRKQKSQVSARLLLLLEWDESMFDLGFNTEYLPMAIAGQAYDGAIYVSGKNGASAKTVTVTNGSLPDGLSLEMDEAGLWARFVGTPKALGTSTFTVELSNDLGELVSKEFTLHVGYAPKILTKTLADACIGTAYYQSIVADAYPDASWNLAEGALPPGLSLYDDGEGASTAHISGIPSKAGTYTFTLACDNFANGIERKTYTLRVANQTNTALDPDQLSQAIEQLNQAKRQLEKAQKQGKALASTVNKLKTRVNKLESRVKKLESRLPANVKINAKVVTAKSVKTALKKARNPRATTVTLSGKVKRIKRGAFKDTNVRKLVIKTTKLTKKSIKGCLKSSKVKTVKVKVANKKLKKTKRAYRKIFVKRVVGKAVSVQ